MLVALGKGAHQSDLAIQTGVPQIPDQFLVTKMWQHQLQHMVIFDAAFLNRRGHFLEVQVLEGLLPGGQIEVKAFGSPADPGVEYRITQQPTQVVHPHRRVAKEQSAALGSADEQDEAVIQVAAIAEHDLHFPAETELQLEGLTVLHQVKVLHRDLAAPRAHEVDKLIG